MTTDKALRELAQKIRRFGVITNPAAIADELDALRAQQPAAVDGAMVRVPRGAAEVAAAVAVEWAEMFAGIPGLEKYQRYNYGPAVEQMRDDMTAALTGERNG